MKWKRLFLLSPFSGNPGATNRKCYDAADNRGIRVAVPTGKNGLLHGTHVIVEMMSCRPKRKRNRVRRGNERTITQSFCHDLDFHFRWCLRCHQNPTPRFTFGGELQDRLKKLPSAQPLGSISHLPGNRCRDGNRDRSRNSLWMDVRDKCGSTGFFSNTFQIIREIPSERRNPHRSAISHRTLATKGICRAQTPITAAIDLVELRPRHTAVPSIRFTLMVPGKSPS